MKKILTCLLAVFLLLAIFVYTAMATDNGEDDRIEAMDAEAVVEATAETVAEAPVADEATITEPEPEPAPTPGEPLTWAYLATIAGAAAATLLIVQFLKVPLDSFCHIPTRLFVYIVCLILMLLGTAFTIGLTAENALLTAVNAFVAALTAYGGYEITFKKLDAKKG